jgi:hypothetical protein
MLPALLREVLSGVRLGCHVVHSCCCCCCCCCWLLFLHLLAAIPAEVAMEARAVGGVVVPAAALLDPAPFPSPVTLFLFVP